MMVVTFGCGSSVSGGVGHPSGELGGYVAARDAGTVTADRLKEVGSPVESSLVFAVLPSLGGPELRTA